MPPGVQSGVGWGVKGYDLEGGGGLKGNKTCTIRVGGMIREGRLMSMIGGGGGGLKRN